MGTKKIPGLKPLGDICSINLSTENLENLVHNGIRMMVGNGERTRFWEDLWLGDARLAEKFQRLYSISRQQNSFIADMGTWEGLSWSWNLVWRRNFFEWELASLYEMQSLLANVILVNEVADKVLWMHHTSGSYNVKSFLNVKLEPLSAESSNYSYANMVWKSLTPPKSELLLWFLVVGRLSTKDRILRLNIRQGIDATCVLCNEGVETINHLFCHCPFTWKVWCRCPHWWNYSWVILENPKIAFQSWLGVNRSKLGKNCWIAWFYVITWSIWELH